MSPAPLRVVVLVSGSGTNLQALLDAASPHEQGYAVVAVGADRSGTGGEERARMRGIPTFVLRVGDFETREEWDRALTQAVASHEPDLVVSAGFLKVLGPLFLARHRAINTHPALLPSFPGLHGVRDALAQGVRVTGCTCHWVDAGVDTGPIIDQRAVRVEEVDTVESLHERIKVEERRMLVEAVRRLSAERASLDWRATTGAGGPPPGSPAEPASPAGVPATHAATRSRRDPPMSDAPTPARASSAPQHPQDVRPVRRALVSVFDKDGLEELVRGLHEAGVDLVSTGGSAALIQSLGVPVTQVEDLTGFPECLEGRVKTLHPRVHAGILADTRKPEHLAALEELEVAPFELVVCNLYPFAETVASGASADECIEQIDIGGPSMVRAAAKNHPSVAIVTSPARYAETLEAVRSGGFSLQQRRSLAAEAFVHTATYDTHVASWMGSAYVDTSDGTGFPAWLGATWDRAAVLRYGENPHQRAALYTNGFQPSGPSLAQAVVLHGKEMSYNNYVDADAAVRAAYDQGDRPTVAVVKHANPCGIAVASEGEGVAQAHRKAHECDPVSAFGGIIATNRPVTLAMAERVKDIFTEVVIAPGFDTDALEVLTRKKNLRLVECAPPVPGGIETRPIAGGLLVQSRDALDAQVRDDSGAVTGGDDAAAWRLVAGAAADDATLDDLQFAWRAVRAVKSNAILLAHDGASVGIGMGQVNRVDSCRLAVTRAGADRARGAVAASDAFFPFADGLQILLDAGVRAVVAPGGSVRDAEVVEAAQAAGVTLYFTGTRHFAH